MDSLELLHEKSQYKLNILLTKTTKFFSRMNAVQDILEKEKLYVAG